MKSYLQSLVSEATHRVTRRRLLQMSQGALMLYAAPMYAAPARPGRSGVNSSLVESIGGGPAIAPIDGRRWKRLEALSDEFDGQALDPLKWLPTDPLWKGMKPSYFSTRNVSVNGGNLEIRCTIEPPPPELEAKGYGSWSTGAVKSVATVQYGYFEVRARMMRSAALSSFWFYMKDGNQQQEVDVFETCTNGRGIVDHYMMTTHLYELPGYVHDHTNSRTWVSPFDMAEEFHVYGLHWHRDAFDYYVDGALIWSASTHGVTKPLNLVLDSEVHKKGCGIPSSTSLPSTYMIDYVRAWQAVDV